MLITKLNQTISKLYTFESGLDLLYLHKIIYHLPENIITGDVLSKVNCEKGEQLLGVFKKNIAGYTGSNKRQQLEEFLQRIYFKDENLTDSKNQQHKRIHQILFNYL